MHRVINQRVDQHQKVDPDLHPHYPSPPAPAEGERRDGLKGKTREGTQRGRSVHLTAVFLCT